MELQYVNFGQAKLLKELGFPKYCTHYYYNEEGRTCECTCDLSKLVYPKPTLELVAKWLRKEKGIDVLEIIHLEVHHSDTKRWDYRIDSVMYSDYEEALSASIDKILGIIIKRNGNDSKND